MSELRTRSCTPCEGKTPPLGKTQAQTLLAQLAGWSLNDAATGIQREFKFKNFYETMAFVNAVAWIANHEDHHPDLDVGYGRCVVRYTTHKIKGLSDNDFICAAKIDALTND